MTNLSFARERECRRSTRIGKAIPLLVKGADAFEVPYQEFALTETVNGHGCRYRTNHELHPGEFVQLEVVHTEDGDPGGSRQAVVKWIVPVERGEKASHFDVGVELNAPGNFWGITNPPRDWPDPEKSTRIVRPNSADGEPAPVRAESPGAFAVAAEPAPSSKQQPAAHANATASPVPQLMTQLFDGLSTQTRTIAADVATLVVREEKDRWLAELRQELQTQTPKMTETVVTAARNELISQTVAIREAVDKHIESATASAMERLQRNIDESRQQAVENCIAQLRTQLIPLFQEAKALIESVKATEGEVNANLMTTCSSIQQSLKRENERITFEAGRKMEELRREFEDFMGARASAARKHLEPEFAEAIKHARESLQELSQASESSAKQHLDRLITSAVNQVTSLQDKTREYSDRMERHSRRQLQLMTELLAKFAAPDPDGSQP